MLFDRENLMFNDLPTELPQDFIDATVGFTEISSDCIDLAAPHLVSIIQDLQKRGDPLKFFVQVMTLFAGTGTADIQLVSDSVVTFDATPTVHDSTGAVDADAVLVAGKTYVLQIQPGAVLERYLGLQLVSSAAVTAGKILGGLIIDRQSANFASGYAP